jgi:hypothetical protein
MAPGIIGVTSGRPKVQGNMIHFSCLVKKSDILPEVLIGPQDSIIQIPFTLGSSYDQKVDTVTIPSSALATFKENLIAWKKGPTKNIPLVVICNGRSGDKGDSSNIGIICRKPEYYPWLLYVLTESFVKSKMNHLLGSNSEVKRYELPGTYSVNFVLTNSLGGGGLSSLQVDRQGKTYAQMLLSMTIPVPQSWPQEQSKI